MAEELPIEQIDIKISADASKAIDGITKLITALGKIQKSVGSAEGGLKTVTSAIDKLASAVDKIDNGSISKIERLGEGIKNLASIKSLGQSKTAQQLAGIGQAAQNLGGSSAEQLKDVSRTIDDLNGTVEIASRTVESKSNSAANAAANAGNKIKDATDKVGKGAKNAKKDTESAFDKIGKSFKNLVTMFSRRVLYRAFNSIISAITSSFKTGIDAVYQYSKSFAGSFSEAMDTIATSTHYITASLGAMASPLIEAVAPAVDWLADKFVGLLNIVNQIFSRLAGKDTWTRAIKKQVEYADATEEATKANKQFKASILGIDEINPLQDNTPTASGSGSSKNDLGNYEYVEEALDKNKVDGWLESLKRIEEIVVRIGAAFVAWKVLKKVATFVKTIKNLLSKFKSLKFVSNFIDGFSLIKSTGGNTFQAIKGGLDNIRANLTSVQKAAIVAVAAVGEFVTVKESVRQLALGADNVAGKIASIGVAAGIAATAMYTAFGAPGLALAAVVGLTGAIVGLAQAQDELRQKIVDKSVFDGVGVSLDTLKQNFEAFTNSVTNGIQPILDMKSQMESYDKTIQNSSKSIETLSATLGATGPVTQEEIDKIKGHFNTLYDAIKQKMELSQEIITTALVDSLKNATPEIAGQIDLLIGEYQRFVRETQGRSEELKTKINSAFDELLGKQKDDPRYQQIMSNITNWYNELGILSGDMSDSAWQWEQTVKAFSDNQIDLGSSIDDANAKIKEIGEAGGNALKDLATARDTVLKEIDNNIRKAAALGNLEDVNMLGDIRSTIEADYASKEQGIKDQINSVFNSIQQGMMDKIGTTKTNLETEWSKMGWFEHWINGDSEASYVRDGLVQMKENFSKISNTIKDQMNSLKTDGSTWASDAASKIIEELFTDPQHVGGGHVIVSYKTDLDTAIKNVYDKLGITGAGYSNKAGENISKGMGEGITSKKSELKKAGAKMVEEVDKSVKDSAEIHSPSKLFSTNGRYMAEGLIKGFENGVSELTSTIKKAIKGAFDTSYAKSVGSDFGKAVGNGVANGFKQAKFPTLKGTMELNGADVNLKLKAYAAGGFPETGQMFMAREAGPELVGQIGNRNAVVNNDQIIAGISEGVADANAEQNALLREEISILRKILDKNVSYSNYNGARSIINDMERKNRRDGKTIIPVGV